ncbi:MAG: monofunctional biosynthetic peptidoglycan transglycosylase [Bacteroidia bacterium]|nr:monofunctional biosynthetic peptidoglycan transglycosylase [Bacteroidia bacterium]
MKEIFRIILFAICVFVIESILSVAVYRFVPVVYTPLMFIRVAQQSINGQPLALHREWTSLDNISHNMVQAVVASEDNLFTEHYGFDFKGIEKAYKNNQRGKRLKGGSTISQQTAKNVFLTPSRSYVRKAFEVYYTVLIELIWSKSRIMEVYLNVIETGNGMYGVTVASEVYFHKEPSKLTKYQAASIAASLPNPRKYKVLNQGPYMQRRTSHIQSLMNKIERVSFK